MAGAAVQAAKRELGASIRVGQVCSIVGEQVHGDQLMHGRFLFPVTAHTLTYLTQDRRVAVKDLDAGRVIGSGTQVVLWHKRTDVNRTRMQEAPDGRRVLPVHS